MEAKLHRDSELPFCLSSLCCRGDNQCFPNLVRSAYHAVLGSLHNQERPFPGKIPLLFLASLLQGYVQGCLQILVCEEI